MPTKLQWKPYLKKLEVRINEVGTADRAGYLNLISHNWKWNNCFVTFSNSVINAQIFCKYSKPKAFASGGKLMNSTALDMVSSTQVFRCLQKSLLRDINSKNTFFRRKVMHRKRFFTFFIKLIQERVGKSMSEQNKTKTKIFNFL